jgi:formate dehydrogenase subunit beta
LIEVGSCFVGWSTDEEVRSRGGSGGLVTGILIAALENGLVDRVAVLKKISEFEAVPVLTDSVEEVKASAGSLHSVPVMMANYVRDQQRLAVTGKTCDIRGIIEESKRNQISLESTYLIGLNCGGSMTPEVTRTTLQEIYDIAPDEVVGEEIEKGKFIVYTKRGEKAFSIDELEERGYGRRESCRYCDVKIPRNADLACGNWGVTGELVGRATFVEVTSEKGVRLLENALEAGAIELEKPDEKGVKLREKINNSMLALSEKWRERLLPPVDSRLEYYLEMLKHCIDCGACRLVCPVCACREAAKCVKYHYRGDSYKVSLYHLIRFLHVADSCIGCGQCSDVCPSEIPIAHLQKRFSQRVQQKFDYTPGMDDRRPPFFEVK